MMYGLFMNMMRDRAERVDLVATAYTAEALVAYMEQHRVEPYQDGSTSSFGGTLNKVFAPGSPLEYYNPPFDLTPDAVTSFGEGIQTVPSREEYIAHFAAIWDNDVGAKRID